MTKRTVTWQDFGKCVEHWLPHIPKYDVYVGVANGGLLLASVLVNINNAKLAIAKYQYKKVFEQTPTLEYGGYWGDLSGSILIVDDITITGHTLSKVMYTISDSDCLTMFQKPGSSIKPKFIWEVTEQDILFPWEARP